MLQSTSTATAAATRGKAPPRHRKRPPASRPPRRVETAVEPGIGNGGPMLVTLPAACALLGVSRMTIYKLIRTQQLGVRRIGKAVRIPVSEIQRFATPGVSVIRDWKTAR